MRLASSQRRGKLPPASRSEDGEANVSAVHGGGEVGALEGGGAARSDSRGGVPQALDLASLLYSWRSVAQDGAGSALKRTGSRGHAKPDAEVARMQAELNRLRAVVTEITAENLELKKEI